MGKAMRVEMDFTRKGVASQNQPSAPLSHLNFSDPAQREAHLQAFLCWLPQVLHDAPGLRWERLPSKVMGYLIRRVADGPDAIPITLALGCAMDAVKQHSLLGYCRTLTGLLRQLRAQYGMKALNDLGTRRIWDQYVEGRTLALGESHALVVYETLAATHLRLYLEQLDIRQRAVWERYALPGLPTGFVHRYGQHRAIMTASQQRRKEQSDILTPLFPLLIEIAQLRKQATERLVKAFQKHRDRARSGEITLPYHFQYTDRIFSLPEDASTIAEVMLVEREVTLSLTLWDRASWVKVHPEQYSTTTHRYVKQQRRAYAPSRTMYFLQYEGEVSDLLWCGDLIAECLLGHLAPSKRKTQGEGKNSSKYFSVARPGLLSPVKGDSVWLHIAARSGEVLFEPMSLYRGVLYATALATVALTNGSRLSELLQVSATRFETLVVDELRDQQPTGRKVGILVQNLLPKGAKQESERQFFLIGEMAGRLLTEIGQLLEATHAGSIPVVSPSQSTQEEDLSPEPYLFQWGASADGRIGLLVAKDVENLLRFLFHRLTLTTRTGKPIRVVPHLLRHVMATHARHVKNVPAEAVAYLLHHRVKLPDSTRALSIPEATAYYSRMPVEHLLALLYEVQSSLASHQEPSYLQVPPPRTLEQMDVALRQVFEQWGLIGPTVLGYCSAGLCIRPNNRALCLDCPHLVPHYGNLRNAKTWRKLYVLQAQLHDAHGHTVDAKQARQMIQYIDDIIRVMEIQIRTRQDAGILPFADTLPPAHDEEGD